MIFCHSINSQREGNHFFFTAKSENEPKISFNFLSVFYRI